MPVAGEFVELFASAGFEYVAHEVIQQEPAPSLRAHYERVRVRAF